VAETNHLALPMT